MCQFRSHRRSLLAQLCSPCCPMIALRDVGLYLSTHSNLSVPFSLLSETKFPLGSVTSFFSTACCLKSVSFRTAAVSFLTDLKVTPFSGVEFLFLISASLLRGLKLFLLASVFCGVFLCLDSVFFALGKQKIRKLKKISRKKIH